MKYSKNVILYFLLVFFTCELCKASGVEKIKDEDLCSIVVYSPYLPRLAMREAVFKKSKSPEGLKPALSLALDLVPTKQTSLADPGCSIFEKRLWWLHNVVDPLEAARDLLDERHKILFNVFERPLRPKAP